MKKKFKIVFAVFVVCLYVICAHLSYINKKAPQDNKYTNDYSETITSDIVGVWKANLGQFEYLYCFEENGLFYCVSSLLYETHNDKVVSDSFIKSNVAVGKYQDKGKDALTLSIEEDVYHYSYEVDNDILYLNDKDDESCSIKMYKKELYSNPSVEGKWKVYDSNEMRFCLIDTVIAPKTYEFYNDGSFRFSRSSENFQIGYYKLINNCSAMELSYSGKTDVYNLIHLDSGLLLLQNSGARGSLSGYVILEYDI